jgi:tetratricopeptide (TPR) repeat protein
MQPDNASASRNLSIMYKKLGTENELLKVEDEALRWYEKALALDRARLARTPDDSLTRLDLSFSLGALGSLALSRSDFASAVASYREAIELRRAVLTADPNDEFARSALVRGYERLARALGHAGHLDEALQSQVRRIAVSREGLAAHADRDQAWVAHAATLNDSIDAALTLIESATAGRSVRAEGAKEIQGLLTELGELRTKWAHDGRKGTLAPSNDELERLIGRARRLSSP